MRATIRSEALARPEPEEGKRRLGASEAASALGVSRNTLLRWFREGRLVEPERDFRGWRDFSPEDIQRLRAQLARGLPAPGQARRPRQLQLAGSGAPSKPRNTLSGAAARLAFLHRMPAFAELAGDDLEALEAIAEFRGYPRGDIIFRSGEDVLGFYILLKGRVRLIRHSPEGRQQILAIVEPVAPFSEEPLFDGTGKHRSIAQTSAVSSLLFLPREPLMELLGRRPAIARAILASLAGRVAELSRKLEETTQLRINQRLARYIVDRAGSRGSIEELNLAEVAALIGAARESVSRALRELKDAGVISVRGRRLKIDEPTRLGQYT